MSHQAVLLEWKSPDCVEGISLHRSEEDSVSFEKFWKESGREDWLIVNQTTMEVEDDLWDRLGDSPSANNFFPKEH